MALSELSAKKICSEKGPLSQEALFNHTMIRIKDPVKSLKFYSQVLGMSLFKQADYPSGKFTLYFMGYGNVEKGLTSKEGVLELTHNWGSENDSSVKYHSGNEEPKGYGHIAIVVPDVEKACKYFEEQNVTFKKKPNEGNMKGIAFIKDPDRYWIEIIQSGAI